MWHFIDWTFYRNTFHRKIFHKKSPPSFPTFWTDSPEVWFLQAKSWFRSHPADPHEALGRHLMRTIVNDDPLSTIFNDEPSLTIFNDEPSLTIFNDDPLFTIFNDDPSLTIVNIIVHIYFSKTIVFFKSDRFWKNNRIKNGRKSFLYKWSLYQNLQQIVQKKTRRC